MRILFSSDLHALRPVFELFSRTLARGPYDAAVLAGDLLDDFWLPDAFLVERFGVSPDDLLEELPDADAAGPDRATVALREAINLRGLVQMEEDLKAILAEAGKPVFLIPGNHDTTPWGDLGPVSNIEGRRLELGRWNLVGYRWTRFELGEDKEGERLSAIEGLVDRNTLLVSHDAPHALLDSNWSGNPIGSKALGRLVRDRRPRWHLFGHVHGAFGRVGRSVNGAYPHSRAFWDIDVGRGQARAFAADVPVVPRIPR
jgi:Icc-related predicted phosphoesterase